MKQVIYILTCIVLSASAGNAQMAAGFVAASAIHKTTVLAPGVTVKAVVTNNTGKISWQANRKLKVRRYELEKSTDGEHFEYVTAVAGSSKQFNISDDNIFEHLNYYRVKIIDVKGNYLYSAVTVLNAQRETAEIKMLETQINQKIFIWLPANTSVNKASIADARGRMLISNALVSNSTNLASVETGTLPVGLYNIKFTTSKGETVQIRFRKTPETQVTVAPPVAVID